MKAQKRFDDYINKLTIALGHKDRAGPARDYCMGLLLPGDRKSVEPMAARISPQKVSARHQSMNHFISKAPWDDEAVLDVASSHVLNSPRLKDPIESWIVDDTGIPKKGEHSVGVARQYCGRLGKQDNCQVAVSVSVASEWISVPVAYRLYLPEDWANDEQRRKKAGVPKDIIFKKKWEIALAQIKKLKEEGKVPLAPVSADAGYGAGSEFRRELTAMGLKYMVGVQENATVWTEDRLPILPALHERSGVGRKRTQLRRDDEGREPIQLKDLAASLGEGSFKEVTWNEGSKGEMRSRFAAVRIIPASRNWKGSDLPAEEWVLIEWPENEVGPTKYWFSTLKKSSSLRNLVKLAKIRWRIERDYQELKGELGLDHFEGRSWRGFHHHASLCIASYAYLVGERLFFSTEKTKEGFKIFKELTLSEDYRPRGSAAG
jgi:SRSO17 transposase